MRPAAEGHFGGDGAAEIFVGDTLEPVLRMGLERVARVDLMT